MTLSLREMGKQAKISHVACKKRIDRGYSWDSDSTAWIPPVSLAVAGDSTAAASSTFAQDVTAPAPSDRLDVTRERMRNWSRLHNGQRPSISELGVF